SVHQLGRIVHDTRPIVPFVTEAPIHRQVGRVAGDLRVHQASGQQAEADDDRDALPTPAFLREHWTYLHELTQNKRQEYWSSCLVYEMACKISAAPPPPPPPSDAHRHQPVSNISPFLFVQKSRRQLGARASEGMAERNGSPVDIESVLIHRKLAEAREYLRGERFVELD